MMLKRAIYLFAFLFVFVTAQSQINVYLGGSLQGNLSRIRGEEPAMAPGFGGGASLIYWEYEYWFIKAGISYSQKNSSILDYGYEFGVIPENMDDKIIITVRENSIGIPLTFYFRPYERGPSSLLLTGSLEVSIVASMKESTEEYGDMLLKGKDLDKLTKTTVGIGAGYQHQLDKYQFLNIYPSFNIDLRGDRAFNSIMLTAEFIFGIY